MTVARTRKTTNHLRHILLGGLLTGGIWWFTGYPICVLRNRRTRLITTITQAEPNGFGGFGEYGGLISSRDALRDDDYRSRPRPAHREDDSFQLLLRHMEGEGQ